jgi:hypothetical protein
MKRRLIGLGIFSPDICRGVTLTDPDCTLIYAELKKLGFVETRWQLIFEGQVGGLVFPYNEGLNEIHVRFYSDRIFAELEFSRSSIFHFVFPLFNANSYVVDLLRGKIPDEPLERLIKRTTENLCDEELARPTWSHRDQANPYKDVTLRGHQTANLIALLVHQLFGWRKLASALATGFAIPIYFVSTSPLVLITLSLLALLCMRYVPTVGRPQ